MKASPRTTRKTDVFFALNVIFFIGGSLCVAPTSSTQALQAELPVEGAWTRESGKAHTHPKSLVSHMFPLSSFSQLETRSLDVKVWMRLTPPALAAGGLTDAQPRELLKIYSVIELKVRFPAKDASQVSPNRKESFDAPRKSKCHQMKSGRRSWFREATNQQAPSCNKLIFIFSSWVKILKISLRCIEQQSNHRIISWSRIKGSLFDFQCLMFMGFQETRVHEQSR